MIQIQINETGIIILEPKNLEYLKQGRILRVPMQYFRAPLTQLILDYTPDVPWVQDQIALLINGKDPNEIDPREYQNIIRRSQSRPEVLERPDHPTLDLLEKQKPQ